ncbi:MAG: hypothetical protein D3903_03975 [Candidatus Electrothrix sp. GM3_4]|nr:hypothetical protein [Candidatus Electrothrix sp. GM3_4]
MNLDKLQTEYQNAGHGWYKAAFRSIIRRNSDERRQLVKTIGGPKSYTAVVSDELKAVEYDKLNK